MANRGPLASGPLSWKGKSMMHDRTATFGDEFTDLDGNRVVIVRDDDPASPREWDCGTTFYTCDHNSPDKINVWSPEFLRVVNDAASMLKVLYDFIEYDQIEADFEEFCEHNDCLQVDYPNDWMFDLQRSRTDTSHIPELVEYINTHGGWALPVSVSESQFGRKFDCDDPYGPYDGIIYMTEKDKDEIGTPDGMEFDVLRGDVANMNSYESGNVFAYEVYDEDDNLVDSMGGFYPDGDTQWISLDVIEDYTGTLT